MLKRGLELEEGSWGMRSQLGAKRTEGDGGGES